MNPRKSAKASGLKLLERTVDLVKMLNKPIPLSSLINPNRAKFDSIWYSVHECLDPNMKERMHLSRQGRLVTSTAFMLFLKQS